MKATGRRVLNRGAVIDTSTINAHAEREERKAWLGAGSMLFAAQQDERHDRQKFLPLVAPASELVRQGAVQDSMSNELNLRGRITAPVTAYPTPTSVSGVVPRAMAQPRITPTQYNGAGSDNASSAGTVQQSVASGTSNLSAEPVNPSTPDLSEDSKGLLLVVAFGAALAAVLVAFS